MDRIFDKHPWLGRPRLWLVVYAALAVLVSAHQIWKRPGSINDFTIFRWSYHLLVQGQSLYVPHPEHYSDLYKYSPAFALIMAPISLLPLGAGLLVWNLVNAILPVWAIGRLRLPDRAKAFVLAFAAIHMLGEIQNTQSNGIMTGLMVATLVCLERRKPVWAALFAVLGLYVKVFGVAAAVLFLLFDRKPRFVLACVGWGLLLAVLPLPITGWHGLIEQYKGWWNVLSTDPSFTTNYSVMTMVESWTGMTLPDVVFLVPGAAVLLLPLAFAHVRQEAMLRNMFCAGLLLWVVIFNHKAGSTTYAIAMFGAGLWGVCEPKSALRTALLWFVFIGTGLSLSDLFPSYVRKRIIEPYSLKVVPCLVLWLYATWRMVKGLPGSGAANAGSVIVEVKPEAVRARADEPVLG